MVKTQPLDDDRCSSLGGNVITGTNVSLEMLYRYFPDSSMICII